MIAYLVVSALTGLSFAGIAIAFGHSLWGAFLWYNGGIWMGFLLAVLPTLYAPAAPADSGLIERRNRQSYTGI